jgi:hypothetical protein
MSILQLVRLVSLVIVFVAAIGTSNAFASEGELPQACTIAQQTECWCEGDLDCFYRNGPPPAGKCWVAEVHTCDPLTGNCTGACYALDEGYCGFQPCGQG